ncbi:hypothetical protein CR513_32549, partial [Mucuna pruriens]
SLLPVSISMLNETKFKVWKEVVVIVLGYMDLNLALWVEKLIPTLECFNRMCLMIMKRLILEAFRALFFRVSASRFLEKIEQFFVKNEKAETSNLLAKLISMKYKGREI